MAEAVENINEEELFDFILENGSEDYEINETFIYWIERNV